MRPIFVLDCVPGALPRGEPAAHPTVAWEDICHGQRGTKFLFINHEPSRSPSRWTFAQNKRPFIVQDRYWNRIGASSTLAGALKIAKREA